MAMDENDPMLNRLRAHYVDSVSRQPTRQQKGKGSSGRWLYGLGIAASVVVVAVTASLMVPDRAEEVTATGDADPSSSSAGSQTSGAQGPAHQDANDKGAGSAAPLPTASTTPVPDGTTSSSADTDVGPPSTSSDLPILTDEEGYALLSRPTAAIVEALEAKGYQTVVVTEPDQPPETDDHSNSGLVYIVQDGDEIVRGVQQADLYWFDGTNRITHAELQWLVGRPIAEAEAFVEDRGLHLVVVEVDGAVETNMDPFRVVVTYDPADPESVASISAG